MIDSGKSDDPTNSDASSRKIQAEAWLKDNAEAIAAHNQRIERIGMFNERLRRF